MGQTTIKKEITRIVPDSNAASSLLSQVPKKPETWNLKPEASPNGDPVFEKPSTPRFGLVLMELRGVGSLGGVILTANMYLPT